MDIIRAKEIIRTLAEGVNPITGEILPKENVYNEPEVIRALFKMLDATAKTTDEDPLRNAGKPWSDNEDSWLRDEFESNVKIADIAREHGRTHAAIESRLAHLGLKKKPFWLFKKTNK